MLMELDRGSRCGVDACCRRQRDRREMRALLGGRSCTVGDAWVSGASLQACCLGS